MWEIVYLDICKLLTYIIVKNYVLSEPNTTLHFCIIKLYDKGVILKALCKNK